MTKREDGVLHFPGSFSNLTFFIYKKLLFVLIVFLFLNNLKDYNLYLFIPTYIIETLSYLIHSSFLPFSLAGILQNYYIKSDWKNVLNVRYLSIVLLVSIGLIIAILFYIISFFLSDIMIGYGASSNDLSLLHRSFAILLPMFVIRPLLSIYRSFYIAFMEDKVVNQSFMIENVLTAILTVLALFGINHIFDYSINTAIYLIVASYWLGSLAALIYIIRFDRTVIGKVSRGARNSTTKDIKVNTYIKLLLKNSIFYFLPVALYFLFTAISYILMVSTLNSIGVLGYKANVIYGTYFIVSEIPMALVLFANLKINQPFIYTLYKNEKETNREYILKLLESSLVISVPICFILCSIAGPYYDFLFGGSNIAIGRNTFIGSSILFLCAFMAYMSSSILLALNHKKKVYTYVLIAFVIKSILYYPVIRYSNEVGIIIVSSISSLSLLYLNLFKIQRIYHLNYSHSLIRLLKIALSIIGLNGLYGGLRLLNFTIDNTSRLFQFLELFGLALAGIVIYCIIISSFKLIDAIYNTSLKKIFYDWNRSK